MAKFNVKIKGLDKLQKSLNKEGQKRLLLDIEAEIENAAVKIDNLAQSKIHKNSTNYGKLAGSMRVEGKDLLWIVYSTANYAPYVEFGTKTKVEIPSEMQEVASQFKGKKLSEGKFKEAIADWMRRKGIPEEALWPIMAKLMSVGQEPKPFLYPSFKEGTKNLQKDIDGIIQNYLNNI